MNKDVIHKFREVLDHTKPEIQILGDGFMGRVKDVFTKEESFDDEQWITVLYNKDEEAIIQILETVDIDVNEPVMIEQTLLYPLTAVMSDLNLVQLLLDYEADPMIGAEEFPEQRPAKPFIEGVFGNFSRSVDAMLENGADPNLRFSYTSNGIAEGFLILSLASLKGNTQTMQSLIDAGADPVAVDNDGRDALTYAVFGNSAGAIRVLKGTKAHLTMGKDQFGLSALDYAHEFGYKNLMRVIRKGSVEDYDVRR